MWCKNSIYKNALKRGQKNKSSLCNLEKKLHVYIIEHDLHKYENKVLHWSQFHWASAWDAGPCKYHAQEAPKIRGKEGVNGINSWVLLPTNSPDSALSTQAPTHSDTYGKITHYMQQHNPFLYAVMMMSVWKHNTVDGLSVIWHTVRDITHMTHTQDK